MWTYVVREQHPSVRMIELFPIPEPTECFLILFLKCMTIYMIELLKRMAGHRGCLHTSLLKKLQIPWSNGCLYKPHPDRWGY